LSGRGVLAVGADNMAWDAPGFKDPELGYPLAGYLILLARYGIYIVEKLALDDLAASGHQLFAFICSLLKTCRRHGLPCQPLVIVAE
jgi:kynurenine formamidase